MLEIIFLIIAFVGSSLAALFDLKTTEIPDEIPYAMMAFGILGHLIKSYLAWSHIPFLHSTIVGLGFLGFGFLMYFIGQWGGGDAKLLSGIGFLLPELPPQLKMDLFFPFPLSFFFNLFLVGAVYMIFYALILSMIQKKIWTVFFKDLKANARMMLVLNSAIVASLLVVSLVFGKFYGFYSFNDIFAFVGITILATLGLFYLWKFVKIVEDVGFKKKIPISELKVGDVPIHYKVWEGITEKELKKIKKSERKYITIKEGVRFAPAFPLALLFTIIVGDGVIWLIGYHV